MTSIVDLNAFADGALAEQFNAELYKVLENIADPNTDGTTGVKLHTRWTQKGRLFIHEVLKTRGIYPLLDRSA